MKKLMETPDFKVNNLYSKIFWKNNNNENKKFYEILIHVTKEGTGYNLNGKIIRCLYVNNKHFHADEFIRNERISMPVQAWSYPYEFYDYGPISENLEYLI